MANTTVFVYTMNRLGSVGAWTRYLFPFEVTDYTVKGNDLYLRHGDIVSRMEQSRESDEMVIDNSVVPVPFDWFIQWPWLDIGQMTVTKRIHGFDIQGTGTARVQFGYDQRELGRFTPEYAVPADSVPGQVLALPLSAPSVSVKVTFTGSDLVKTGLEAFTLFLDDNRMTS